MPSMRNTLAALISVFAVGNSAVAQTIVDNGIDDRIEALNAVFAFRNDLSANGTVIARCRIPTAHPDTGAVPGLDARFQSLLARPDSVQAGSVRGCAVYGFADPKHRKLFEVAQDVPAALRLLAVLETEPAAASERL